MGKSVIGALAAVSLAMASNGAHVVESNPGLLDDPACRGLVVAQLKSQNQKLEDWIVEFNRSVLLPDGQGGMNIYHVTSRKDGQIWEIAIALHSEQIAREGH